MSSFDDALSPDPRPPTPDSRLPTRGGLGRGLGALIPPGRGLQEIGLAQIRPNPQQPRLRTDERSLAELAESIRQHGVLQPVVVTRSGQEAQAYILVAGERRWRAAQLLGLETIPAVVKEAAPRDRLELALVENIQREDLGPLEMAVAYRALIEEHGLTQDQVAQRVGKSRVAVANTLRLLQLPPPAREALADGHVSEGHARALLGAPDEATLLDGLSQVLEQGLTVRQTEELTRRLSSVRARETPSVLHPPPPADSAETAYLEERLRQALGTKVQLVRARRGGRLIIHFYSDEELDGIYEKIAGPER